MPGLCVHLDGYPEREWVTNDDEWEWDSGPIEDNAVPVELVVGAVAFRQIVVRLQQLSQLCAAAALGKYTSDPKRRTREAAQRRRRDSTGKHLDVNDLMPTWVSEHYEDADEIERAFIAIKDLYYAFKTSEHYQKLNRRERPLMNLMQFRSAISKSAKYKPKYRASQRGSVRDGTYHAQDGLVDLKKKCEDQPDETEQ